MSTLLALAGLWLAWDGGGWLWRARQARKSGDRAAFERCRNMAIGCIALGYAAIFLAPMVRP